MDPLPPESDAHPTQSLHPTPDFSGYVVAVVIAIALGSVLIAAILVLTEFGFNGSDLPVLLPIIGVFASLAALVVAFPLIAIAHVWLHVVRAQWIHVAAFAGIGTVVGLLSVSVVLSWKPAGVSALITLAVAVSSAVGRLCVSGPSWRKPFPFDP